MVVGPPLANNNLREVVGTYTEPPSLGPKLPMSRFNLYAALFGSERRIPLFEP